MARRSFRAATPVALLVGLLCTFALAGCESEAPIDDREARLRLEPDWEEKLARAQATPDLSRALDPALAPPPPDVPPYVGWNGYVQIRPWDDRHLSREDRLADPWERPGAHEFAACIEGAFGYVIDTAEPPGVITDDEITALVRFVNRDGPFLVDDRTRIRYEAKGHSDVLVACALAHLTS